MYKRQGKGLIRHIHARKGWESGQILVCLVVNGDRLPRQEALLARLQNIPGFATLLLSVNRKPGNAVLGEVFHTLYGPGWIEDTLCGLTFRLSPRSFYQVNHDQAERLYEMTIQGAESQATDTVLDLSRIHIWLAELRGVTPEAMQEITTANGKRLYRLSE